MEEAKIDPSAGGVGDSCDNAMARTENGLCKAEVVKHEGPWHGRNDVVEFATLEWVHWTVDAGRRANHPPQFNVSLRQTLKNRTGRNSPATAHARRKIPNHPMQTNRLAKRLKMRWRELLKPGKLTWQVMVDI